MLKCLSRMKRLEGRPGGTRHGQRALPLASRRRRDEAAERGPLSASGTLRPMAKSTLRLVVALVACMAMAACAQREHSAVSRGNVIPGKASESQPPILDLVRADQYTLFDRAATIPDDVRVALAREFGESTLEMASGAEPFNGGCLIQPGLPRRRLLLAAVSPRFAVVHFEVGGFAVAQNVLVLRRTEGASAEKVWSNVAATAWAEPQSFRAALRSGALLVDVSKTLPIGRTCT